MVNLMIHNKCNQFCVFCNTQKLLQDNIWKDTDKVEIVKQLENAAKKDTEVNFTGGGEPTMLKDLPEMIKYAKSLGIEKVCIETNAILLSYIDYVRKLKESGLDYCIVSLHSYKEGISDQITQTPGGFKYTIQGLKNILRADIKVRCILHTINKLNYKDLINFIIFVKKNFSEINNFGFSFIRPIANDKKSQSITPSLNNIKKYLHEALSYCKKNSINIDVSPGLGIPLCFMEGFEEYVSEFLIYLREGRDEHKKRSYQEEKIKGEQCKVCKMNICCSGVHKNYADLYGTDELVPLHTDLNKLIKKCKETKNIY